MPVATSDILWQNSGVVTTGTSVVVTHPDAGGTTAGSTVVVVLNSGLLGVTLPTGFISIATHTPMYVLVKVVGAGETSWTFTTSNSTSTGWYMAEVANLAGVDVYDGSALTDSPSTANAATVASGTATNAGESGLALAVFGSLKTTGTDLHSWSGYTNSFVEQADTAPGSGSTGRGIAVAAKTYSGWSTWSSTGTFATTGAAAQTVAITVLLRSADAAINAPLSFFTTFGFGTHAGMGSAANSPLGTVPAIPTGTWGTNYSVGLNGRSGGYSLDVTAAASIANVLLPTTSFPTLAFGANVKAVSGSGTPTAVHFAMSGGSTLQVRYDVTNQKFGLTFGGGTTVWQAGTTAVGAYAWVDVRLRANGAVFHADWSVESVEQTSPADLTGQTAITSVDTYLGYVSSQTAVFRYSDVVLSRFSGAYPLGPHTVRTLVPETTGATVSGTAANFNRFTANGTLAAVNGTEGALLDEIPPTISASSDGVVQVTAAASDYIQFPMTTYTLTSSEIIAGVRFVASEWGGTGTGTGTLGWRGYDGTTETVFQAASALYDADSLTTASATYPRWVAAMWSGGVNGAWNQTRLNAAAIRMGFSTDATPDMGASAVYLEVATRVAPTVRTMQTMTAAADFTADIIVNPYNSATVSYVVTNNDPTLTATFNYSVSGVPQTPVTVAPSSNTTVDIHADNFGDISDIALTEG